MRGDVVINEIVERIFSVFSFQIEELEPLDQGYQNKKWIAVTDQGEKLFIKSYSPVRYPPEKLRWVQIALKMQQQLYEEGVVCPKLYGNDQEYLLRTPSGFAFCLMEVCDGTVISPGQANWLQMYDLGRVTGYMHQILSRFPSGQLCWAPTRLHLLQKWRGEWERACSEERSLRVRFLLKRQKEIIESIDMQEFKKCPTGWAHQDLWMDNILFQGNLISGILDFDRLNYGYPDLDIARVLLSGAFSSSSGMNMEKVTAFVEGYRQYRELTTHQLARAFRLLWCQESPKWFTADIEDRSVNPQRFFEEVCWILEHWWDLEDVLKID
ncbi:phosphotransferase enzyme family protein [Thermoflavimicrobium dichotomicum]|nr:phosphotransferase [Thermoflavimicrobium dichotomicum]